MSLADALTLDPSAAVVIKWGRDMRFQGRGVMKGLTNIGVVLLIFTLPVFSYAPGVDLTGDNFAIEACTKDAFGGFAVPLGEEAVLFAHGGGLNKCGCHFNRKTGECHCHRDRGCGCECEPSRCD